MIRTAALSYRNRLILETLLLSSLLALLLCSSGLQKEFYSRGEAREGLVSQAMIAQQDWVLPSVYDDRVPSKPPMSHWVSAMVATVTGGVSEFSTRSANILAAVCFSAFFYSFLRDRFGFRVALVSLLTLLSTFEWLRASLTTRVDLFFSALLASSLITWFLWWENRRERYPVTTMLLLTSAFLTKGPIAVVLFGFSLAVFFLFQRERFVEAVSMLVAVCLPAGLLAAVWYSQAVAEDPGKLLDMIWYENVQRAAGTMEENPHNHSVLHLYGMAFLGLLPWSLIALPSGFRRLRDWRSIRIPSNPWTQFCLAVIVAVFVFFAIPSSKRAVYLLPAFPFIAYLFSFLLFETSRASRQIIFICVRIGFGFLFILFAGVALYFGLNGDLSWISEQPKLIAQLQWFQELMRSWFAQPKWFEPALFGIVLFTLATASLSRGTGRVPGVLIVSAVFVTSLFVAASVLPRISSALSPRSFSAILTSEVPDGATIYGYDDEFYALSFYSERQMLVYEERIPAGAEVPHGAYVVLYSKKLEKFREYIGFQDFHPLVISQRAARKPRYRILLGKFPARKEN